MATAAGQKCVMIIAGEASGDQHGAKLVAEMRRTDPCLFFCGIGGQALADVGVRIITSADALTVVGITEVFSKLPTVYRAMTRVKKLLQSLKPDLLILIDFPDFNLRVASAAKKFGIPVLYYISPQIWAWRRGRVNKIGNLVDHMAVILPFEAEFYRSHGIPVSFVGHPLLDSFPEHPSAGNGVAAGGKKTIGLLPGSREVEIERLLPVMLQAALRLKAQDGDLTFIVSQAPSVKQERLKTILAREVPAGGIALSPEPVERLIKRCCLVVAASGTVTLQAAICGTPMVIVYKVSPMSYWLGRALIRIEHIGLINLIAGKRLVPELIQDQASAENIAEHALTLLADEAHLARLKRDLLAIKEVLGGAGASRRVAEIARSLLWQAQPSA